MAITQSGKHKEKKNDKNKEILKNLWNTIKWTNLCIMEIPEREKREQKAERLLREIMVENSPNLGGNGHPDQRSLKNTREKNPKEIYNKKHCNKVVKSQKLRISKAAREMRIVTHKGTP